MSDELDLFGPPSPVAHARREDPSTSHEAAASVTDITEKQQAVLRCLRLVGPRADVEWIPRYFAIQQAYGWPVQSLSGLRTRRSELHQQGKVGIQGEKYIGRRNHIIWTAL